MKAIKYHRYITKKIETFIKSRFPKVILLIRFYYFYWKYSIVKLLIRFAYSSRRKNGNGKILTLCLGGLGDVIHATPFYTSLKTAMPDCKLDAIVSMWVEDLLKKNLPVINRIVPYPINAKYMNNIMMWRFFRDLYIENYDYYFCIADYTYPPIIPHNLYGAVIGYVADIPERVGIYRQRNSRFIKMERSLIEKIHLYTRFGFDELGFHGSDNHSVFQHLHLLKIVGIEPDSHDLALYPDPVSDAAIERYLDGFVKNNDLVILFAPTSASLVKQWSHMKFAELADRLASDFGAKIVIACSEAEKVGELIKIMMNNKSLSFSGDNALSLPQFVSLAKRSHLCIGNDSGATHAAIAVSTPVVMLFGASPVNFAKPLDEKKHRFLVAGDFLNPIQQNNKLPESEEKRNIDLITVDAVYDACVSILKQEYPQFYKRLTR